MKDSIEGGESRVQPGKRDPVLTPYFKVNF